MPEDLPSVIFKPRMEPKENSRIPIRSTKRKGTPAPEDVGLPYNVYKGSEARFFALPVKDIDKSPKEVAGSFLEP